MSGRLYSHICHKSSIIDCNAAALRLSIDYGDVTLTTRIGGYGRSRHRSYRDYCKRSVSSNEMTRTGTRRCIFTSNCVQVIEYSESRSTVSVVSLSRQPVSQGSVRRAYIIQHRQDDRSHRHVHTGTRHTTRHFLYITRHDTTTKSASPCNGP